MGHAYESADRIAALWPRSARLVAAVRAVVAAIAGAVGRPGDRRIAVPPVSAEWLEQHEHRSSREGDA